MENVRILWKVVRRPMLRWWGRCGSWWLLGIMALAFINSLINHWVFPPQPLITLTSLQVLGAVNYFMPLVLVVVAASVCDGFVSGTYEQQAAPMPKEILWGRYLLALGQAIPVAVATTIALIAAAILCNYRGLSPSGDCPFGLWITFNPIGWFAGYAVRAIWLTLFVVLAANRPWLKYGVITASLIGSTLNTALFLTITLYADYPNNYAYSESRLLYLLALPIWLLLANSLKLHKFKWANVLLAVIVISIIGNMSIISLYRQFGGSLLKALGLITETINSAYFFYPEFMSPIGEMPGSSFDPQDTVLGYLPFVIEPILAWIQPCFLLGVIYLFVFFTFPRGWIDYCLGKTAFPRKS